MLMHSFAAFFLLEFLKHQLCTVDVLKTSSLKLCRLPSRTCKNRERAVHHHSATSMQPLVELSQQSVTPLLGAERTLQHFVHANSYFFLKA